MTEENKSKIKKLLDSNEIKLAAALIEGFDENTEECWMELLDMDPYDINTRQTIYYIRETVEIWYIPINNATKHGFGVWKMSSGKNNYFEFKDYPTETECKLAAIKLFIKYIDEI